MKRLHKILMGGAVALALAVAFAGCKNANDTVGEAEMISYTSSTNSTTKAEATASIDYPNMTGDYVRGMRLFNNQKKGISANVVMTGLDSNNANPGLMGIVFDMEQDKTTKAYDFIMVGYKNKSGKACATVTYYRNVSESNFSANNFGATMKNNQSDFKTAAENGESVSLDFLDWTDLECTIADKKLSLGIVITPFSGTTDAYKINFYTGKTCAELKTLANDTQDARDNADLYVLTITNENISKTNKKTPEGKMGFYANVYTGQTLKGEWQVADITHNPNGIFWCDEENPSRAAVTNLNPMGIELVK